MSQEEAETMATTGLAERCARLLWPEREIRRIAEDLYWRCDDEALPDGVQDFMRTPGGTYWIPVDAFGEPSPEGWAASGVLVEALRERGFNTTMNEDSGVAYVALWEPARMPNPPIFEATAGHLPEALAIAFCEAMEANAGDEREEGATP